MGFQVATDWKGIGIDGWEVTSGYSVLAITLMEDLELQYSMPTAQWG